MTESELKTIHLLVKLWPVLLFLLGLAAAWGGMLVRVRKIEKAQADRIVWQAKQEKAVEDLEASISTRLYDAGHEPLFVTVRRCERTHTTMEVCINKLVDSHENLSRAIHMHLGEHGKGG
jgi:hypothetical protein